MPDKKLEQDFKHLSAANDYLELARQDAIALAESFKQERDQLREAAEKLAEALADLYECELQEWGKEEWEVDEKDTSALGNAKKALAEYREQFPKK